ncbi:MAG: hypothetical protein PHO71_17760 [Bacteroides sp.]|nr:hypothetical protein [Bacteroides sp.]
MKMLLFHKKDSKDYLTIAGSAMILHEFPEEEETTEQVSLVLRNKDGSDTKIRFDKIDGEWLEEYDSDLKDYIMDFLKGDLAVSKYKKGDLYL